MFKKFRFYICLTLIILLFSGITAGALAPVLVVYDGAALQFDVQPQIISGRIMVPMRVIFEALGAEVTWDGKTRTITATSEGLVVTTTIGDKIIRVNGEARPMDIAPIITGDRTLVPVRFISEAFGCEVRWVGSARVVYIDSPDLETFRSDYDDGTWRIDELDESGNLIRMTSFNADGSVREWSVFQYNEKGFRIRETFFDPDGSVIAWWIVVEHDANGCMLKVNRYNERGVFIGWFECEYDEMSNLIKQTFYNPDGTIDVHWSAE